MKKKQSELVSVIIPTYKRASTLGRAINSVLNQSYKNIEVIVVDDNHPGSNERAETEKLINTHFRQPQVNYIQHEINKNGSAARNTGFRHSSGEYIMFLDDDDEFLEYKVERQYNHLSSLPTEWGACYTSYLRMKDGEVVMKGAEKREGNLLVEELKRNLFIHAGSNLMLRRSVVNEVGGFDESFQRNQDIEFMIKVLKKYKLAYVDYIGLLVNVHEKKEVDFEKVTNHYLGTFEDVINELEEEEKQEVIQMINLQLFRYFLFNKRSFNKVFVVSKDLPNGLIIRYLIHLIMRKTSKKAFGFDVK